MLTENEKNYIIERVEYGWKAIQTWGINEETIRNVLGQEIGLALLETRRPDSKINAPELVNTLRMEIDAALENDYLDRKQKVTLIKDATEKYARAVTGEKL